MNETGRASREYTEVGVIKKLFDAIRERKIADLQMAVLAIGCLERITGSEFKDTKDFLNKMEQFFKKYHYVGKDLRRARKESGMERSDLATRLGESKHAIKHMETNKKPLSQDAIEFIKEMGGEKQVPLKKYRKKGFEPNSMDMPKKDKIPPEKKLQNEQVSDLIECDICNKEKEAWMIRVEKSDSCGNQLICENCISIRNKNVKQDKDNDIEIQMAT